MHRTPSAPVMPTLGQKRNEEGGPMKDSCLIILMAVLYTGCSGGDARDEIGHDPIQRVMMWEKDIRDGNVTNLAKHFSKEFVGNMELVASRQAQEFWNEELSGEDGSLDAAGFEGEWIQKRVKINGENIALVFPVISNGAVMNEAVWLVNENGDWKIKDLFNTPPAN